MESTINLIKDIFLIFGIVYGIYEYFLFRKNRAKTDDKLEVKIFDLKENKFLIDIKIRITNKSHIRKYLKKMVLSLKTLSKEDIIQSIESKRMVQFSNKIISKYKAKDLENNILEEYPKKVKKLDFWIDANTSQTFYYPIVMESNAKFVQINIEYPMNKSGMKYFSRILKLEELKN